MNRQLYMGGGIMNARPRQKFFLGGVGDSIKDIGKKAFKGIKDIATSDVGKAALLAAGVYKLGGGQFGKLFSGGPTGFSLSKLPGASLFTGGAAAGIDPVNTELAMLKRAGQLTKAPFLSTKLGKFATLGGLSAFLTSQFGLTEEQQEEVLRDPENLKKYLRLYYKNLNQDAKPEEVEKFVETNTAEYTAGMGAYAEGGRIKKALGDTASDNAMQAAGIEGLPVRQNPKGVKELDLRETGGFIPPVGIKEKEDDIPAMLSNNEFVFTADAVRGMGDGDVDVGAQRMYDMMKQLEAGGRV